MMGNFRSRLLSAVLAAVTAVALVSPGYAAQAATASAGYATGDIISLGSYPQTKVTDSTLISILDTMTLSAENTVTYGGSQYLRVYFGTYTAINPELQPTPANTYQDDNGYYINTAYWFKIEPIRWKVLSNEGNLLFVMSEMMLEARGFHSANAAVTWETSAVRTWLNNDFINKAFSTYEQSQIVTSSLVNEDNPTWGTDGGNDTQDKLFLLSYSDSINSNYGFYGNPNSFDTARRAQGTDYAKSKGIQVSTSSSYLGNSSWWLRTPGKYASRAVLVNETGSMSELNNVYFRYMGIRPAMRIALLPDYMKAVEGSGCVVDKDNHFIYGLSPGISSLDGYAVAEEGCSLSYGPGVLGTGSAVNVIQDGETVESYTVVIFGDVNGDGIINAIDADVCNLVQNWMVVWDEETENYYYKAGDVNADSRVDTVDADLLNLYENWILDINQTTGIAG